MAATFTSSESDLYNQGQPNTGVMADSSAHHLLASRGAEVQQDAVQLSQQPQDNRAPQSGHSDTVSFIVDESYEIVEDNNNPFKENVLSFYQL